MMREDGARKLLPVNDPRIHLVLISHPSSPAKTVVAKPAKIMAITDNLSFRVPTGFIVDLIVFLTAHIKQSP